MDEGRGSVGDESTEQVGAVEGGGIGEHPHNVGLEGCEKLLEGGLVTQKVMMILDGKLIVILEVISNGDAHRDFQLSDIDTRNDFLGFEERDESEEWNGMEYRILA